MIYECSYNNIKGRHCYLALMNDFCLFYKYHTDVYVTVVGSTGSVTRTGIACGSGKSLLGGFVEETDREREQREEEVDTGFCGGGVRRRSGVGRSRSTW